MGLGSGKAGIIILICGILGLFIAAVEQIAFENEYVLQLYVTAAELPGLQIMSILIFLLAGGVLAAITS